jgi:hypothetical protein
MRCLAPARAGPAEQPRDQGRKEASQADRGFVAIVSRRDSPDLAQCHPERSEGSRLPGVNAPMSRDASLPLSMTRLASATLGSHHRARLIHR